MKAGFTDMADENTQNYPPVRSKDEVALELMKFIAGTTGFGKGLPQAGFGTKADPRTPEDHAEALLQLFERCRQVVLK